MRFLLALLQALLLATTSFTTRCRAYYYFYYCAAISGTLKLLEAAVRRTRTPCYCILLELTTAFYYRCGALGRALELTTAFYSRCDASAYYCSLLQVRRTRARGGALGARAAKHALLLLADAQRLLKVLAKCTTTYFTTYRALCQQKLATFFTT